MSSFNSTSRTLLQSSTILTGMIAIMALSQPAFAVDGANVVGGQASIAQSGATTDITQGSHRALIEWNNFDIGNNETVNFYQPSSSSIALNRVVGAGATQIDGKLNANGNVIIVNGQGVMFGAGAQVNVGGLVATTADIENSKFMAGDLKFDKAGNANAKIQNDGSIKVADGGLSLFVGPNVSNNGLIQANLGKVQMASGETFAVDMYGDGLLSVQASDTLTKQLVKNSGAIEANGGQVLLTAAAAQSAVESVINMDGIVQANTINEKAGKIVLSGEGATTLVSGKIDAKGSKGGDVTVTGKNVALLSGATIDASGANGGGKVKVGGDFHGQGSTPTATNTVVQTGATILANATDNGNGGDVAVWADNNTFFYGDIEAKGGANGGNGGFIETSGKIYLDAFGNVDASANAGNAGTWLLDPNDIIITSSPDSDNNVTGNPNFTTTNNNGRVGVTSIQTNLNAGTSVTITTGAAGGNTQTGTITVQNSISKTAGGDASLTLSSHNNIVLNNNVSISSSAGRLNVSLLSNNDSANGGSINMGSGSSINSNGGNVVLAGGVGGTGYAQGSTDTSGGTAYGVYIGGSINAAGGDITIRGQGRQNGSTNNYGVQFENGTPTIQTNGSGNITITGIGGGTGSNSTNHGIYSINANTAISTVNGNITMTGTGGGATGGNNNDGIRVENGTTSFTSTGTGSVSLTGTGGGASTTSDGNNGINFYNNTSTITANSGNVSLTGTGGGTNNANSDDNNGIRFENGTRTINSASGTITISGTQGGDKGDTNYGMQSVNTTTSVGAPASTANILFKLDRMNFTNGTFSAQTTQRINIETVTAPTSIGVAGGAGDLQLTSAFLNTLTAGKIVIGSQAGSGAITANARTWQAPVSFRTGTGNININGLQTMGARQFEAVSFNGGDIILGASGGINSSATGDAIVLATSSGDFINNNAGSPLTASAGRWLIYSTTPGSNTYGSLASDFFRYSCTFGGACPSFPGTGNGFLYSESPVVTVTLIPDPATTTYGQAAPTFTYTFSGYNGGDEAADSRTGAAVLSTNYVIGNDVGQYNITADAGTLTSSLGYVFQGSTLTNGLTVNAADLTVTANDVNMVYGAGNVFNGFSATGLYGGQTIGSVTLDTNAVNSTSGNWSAGTWTITASAATGGTFNPNNYNIIYQTGNLNVAKKTINTIVTAQDKVYDGLRNATVSLSNDAIAGDVVITSEADGARFDTKDVGNDKQVKVSGLSISGDDANNYELAATQAFGMADITPAALTITANDQSQTYGDGNVFSNGFNTSGLANGETVGSVSYATDATLSTGGHWNAGSWDITASNATGGTFDANNYTITYVDGALDVAKRDLSITLVTADDKVYDGNNTAYNVVLQSDNRATGDTGLSYGYSGTGGTFDDKNVGTDKTVTVTGLFVVGADAANYNLNTLATGLADITPAALTITANNQSQTYGEGNNFTSGISSSGLQGSDAIDSATLSTDATLSSSLNWNAGTWSITASNATGVNFDPNNYTITYNNGTLTIGQKSLIVSAVANDKVYDGNRDATVTLTNDAIAGDVVNNSYTTARFGNKNAGNNKTVTVNGIAISGGADAANYSLSNTTTTDQARITKASLTVTANNQSQVYGDGNNLTNGYQITGLVAGETVGSVTLSTDATSSGSGNWNAGTWNIIGSGATGGTFDIGNYSVTYTNGTLNILQKNLTTVVTAQDKVYDGTRTATVSFTDNRIAGDVFTEDYANARFNNKNVGNNKTVTVNNITLTGADAANYNLTNTIATDTANITPAALTITANDQTQTYGDGNVLTAGVTGTGLVAGETLGSVDLATNAPNSSSGNWNAGSWDITASNAQNNGDFRTSNYTITYEDGTLTVNKKDLGITANNQSQTYGDGNNFTTGFTTNGLVGSETVGNVDYATNAGTSTSGNWNAGTWDITASNANGGTFDANNYNITYTNGQLSIAQKALAVTASAQDKVYDGNTTATVTLSDDRISGDVLSASNTSADFSDKNVGDDKTVTVSGISISGTDSANYIVNTDTTALADITPASLTVRARNKTQTYGDGNTFNGFTSTGLVGGDVIDTVDYATNAGLSGSGNWNAGNNWTITASNATGANFDAGNYNITYQNGTLRVNRRILAALATGGDKVYDGNTTATVTMVDNRITGDVFDTNYGSANFLNKNVGNNKAIVVTGVNISGADAGNYFLITPISAGLADITPASLTITANNQAQVYGAGNSLTEGVSSSGLVAGETLGTVSIATNATNSTSGNWNAGSWDITASNAQNNGAFRTSNYSITYVDGDLTVTPKALNVTALADDKVYDGNRIAVATLADDRIAGDVFDTSFNRARFDTRHVGTDKTVTVRGIAISGTDAANYTNNTVTTTLADITPASLTITANDQNQVYADGNNLVNGVSVSGLVGGESIGSVDLATDATLSTSGNWNAGSWDIEASNVSNNGRFRASNYDITYIDGTLAITPKTLNISATADNKVYDGTTTANVTLSDDRVSGDLLTAANASADFDDRNVGTGKTVFVNGLSISGTDAANYTIAASDIITFADITPYTLTVIADDQTKVYGDIDPTLTYSFGTLQTGDDSSVFTGGLSRAAGETVAGGPYVINQGSLSAGSNYTIAYVEGLLRITPATINVFADSHFIVLGGNIPPLTYTATGFKFEDGYGIFTGGLSTVPRESLPGIYPINRGTLEANSNYTINYNRGFLTIGSPFATNNTNEQLSEFVSFNGPSGPSTLLSVSNTGPTTPTGGLGNLAPAAGGENLGDLDPSAGGNALALLECTPETPCDMAQ